MSSQQHNLDESPPVILPRVHIHTDGAHKKNQRAGGWAGLLIAGQHQMIMYDRAEDTTNNRMELTAVIESLRQLTVKCEVVVFSDSMYVVKGINQYLANWVRQGWRTKARQPVKNRDLWEQVDELARQHFITARWVKGHNGNEANEVVDYFAQKACYEIPI